MKSGGTAIPIVKIRNPKGDDIVNINGTNSTSWQAFSARYAWPNCSDTLDQDGIYFVLELMSDTLNTGLKVFFDDVSIRQTVYKKPVVNCWGCKHFAPIYVQGAITRMGECRVQPPLQPIPSPLTINGQPIFAGIADAAAFWCNAWQRSAKAIPSLPALPVDWPYDNLNPPPIYSNPRPE
jgi:hypothetical protein